MRSPVHTLVTCTCVLLVAACDTPFASVVLANRYSPSAPAPLVVYRAFGQSVAFAVPVAPGAESAPLSALPASANTAYVVVAPGWDPASATAPASLVVLESKRGFALNLNETLRIPVDDAGFAGDCAAGSLLAQDEADFIVERVFAEVFAGLAYDAATCTTTPIGDAGTPR